MHTQRLQALPRAALLGVTCFHASLPRGVAETSSFQYISCAMTTQKKSITQST